MSDNVVFAVSVSLVGLLAFLLVLVTLSPRLEKYAVKLAAVSIATIILLGLINGSYW